MISTLAIEESIAQPVQQNKMQIVFAIDVTGSMGGLIQAAKDKIWSIANSLKQGNPNIDLEIGLVAYKDRGDNFVTKIVGLNSDIDAVFAEINSLSANGGGDDPESVNQALNDAVTKMSWGHAPNDIRTIFLVGDCPPHMDYKRDTPYQKTCETALQKDIVINTIQMGQHRGTEPVWREIAALTHGEYNSTDMNVNQVVIATPYDDLIKQKSIELEQSKVFYGNANKVAEEKKVVQDKIKSTSTMTSESAARRADYLTNSVASDDYYGSSEIINEIKEGNIAIEDISYDELPEEIKVLEEDERTQKLEEMVQERVEAEDELDELIRQRDSYVTTNTSVEVVETSLTNKVIQSVKKQAKKKDIKLEGKAKF